MKVRSASFVAVTVVVFSMFIAPIGRWPWDHDEVQSLMELGAVPMQRYPGPVGQMERLHRLIPVWSGVQSAALRILPVNEWGTRLVPSALGALIVVIGFGAALKTIRPWFAWSLLVFTGGSQTLVWLSQQNRFYSLALLWTTICYLCIWTSDERPLFDAAAGLSAAAAVLSHNLTLVVFGLGALAAIVMWLFGGVRTQMARRAVLAAALPAVIYLLYLRPLLAGWISGGTAGTNPVVSYVAQTGIAPIALALVGGALSLWSAEHAWVRWWLALFALSIAFIAAAPTLMGNWNPRYALFFMPPVWVLAAAGSAAIAEALASKRLAVWWFAALCVLLAPKLASHYIDGSRHDFRTAARIVADRAPKLDVVSNWPADLQYYLEPLTGQKASYWGKSLPSTTFVAVIGSNAWEPVLHVDRRAVTVLGEVSRRRFDEQSHVVRVYLVDSQ